MVESGGGRLNPLQPSGGDDAVPVDGNLGMPAEKIGVMNLLGDVLLAGVDDFRVGSDRGDLPQMTVFHRVAKNNPHGQAGKRTWRLGSGEGTDEEL